MKNHRGVMPGLLRTEAWAGGERVSRAFGQRGVVTMSVLCHHVQPSLHTQRKEGKKTPQVMNPAVPSNYAGRDE